MENASYDSGFRTKTKHLSIGNWWEQWMDIGSPISSVPRKTSELVFCYRNWTPVAVTETLKSLDKMHLVRYTSMCIFSGENRSERYHTFVMMVKVLYIQYRDAYSKVSSTNETQVSFSGFEDYTDTRMCLNIHTCMYQCHEKRQNILTKTYSRSHFLEKYILSQSVTKFRSSCQLSLKELELGQVWRAARGDIHLTNNRKDTEHIHISKISIATLFIDL